MHELSKLTDMLVEILGITEDDAIRLAAQLAEAMDERADNKIDDHYYDYHRRDDW